MKEFGIPPNIAHVLTELTEEPRTAVAITSIVKDALEHRLELCEKEIKEFEAKWKMSFEEFKKKWKASEIKDKHSYEVEKDYWKWEGAISRKKKLKELLDKCIM